MRTRHLAFFASASLLACAAACGDDSSGTSSGSGGGAGTGGASSSTTTATTQAGPVAVSSSSAGPTTTGPTTGQGGETSTSTGQGGDTTTSTGQGGDGTGGEGTGAGGVGGSGATCDAEVSETRIAVAQSFGTLYCSWLERCTPGYFPLYGGTIETCAGLVSADLKQLVNVDDAAFTTCLSDAAEAYEDAACAAVPPPASCQGVGTLGEGESCASAFECASLLCLAEDDETGCGTCHVAVEDGDPCVEDAQCPSLACVEGVCGEPGGEGAPCDSLPDCTTNACAQGACAEVSVSGEGEPCGDGESYCTPGAELLCDVDQGECVANPRPEPGALDEACVLYTIDLGGFAFEVPLCEEGTTCVEDVCVLASLPFGSCGDGQECIGSVCEAGTCAPEVDPNLCACP